MKYLFFVLILAFAGCSHNKGADSGKSIIPIKEESRFASFSDSGKQDSGVLGFNDETGFFITEGTVKRYNHLISIYGHEFVPPLEQNYGISHDGENFLMSEEAMQDFILLVEKTR